MKAQDFIEVRMPVYLDPDYEQIDSTVFLWRAAAVHHIWEVQKGGNHRQKSPGSYPRSAIGIAHSRWLDRHTDRADLLYETIDLVERLAQDGSEIPPSVSAFLSVIYEELYIIIREEIWSYGGEK